MNAERSYVFPLVVLALSCIALLLGLVFVEPPIHVIATRGVYYRGAPDWVNTLHRAQDAVVEEMPASWSALVQRYEEWCWGTGRRLFTGE